MLEFVAAGPGRVIFETFAFLFGLSVGSFLNVVIARVPEGLSVVRPPSRCPVCEKPIAWYDNIPLLSWLLLRGRCRGCRTPIAVRYPVVELLVGLLALALARRYGLDWRTLTFFTFAALLVAITYIDLDHWIIPHVLTWPGIAIGLVSSAVNPDLRAFDSAVGMFAGFFVFSFLAVLGSKAFDKDALGAGDWWLLAMIGAFLGWQALLPVVLLASVQGSVVGILLIVAGRSEQGVPEPETGEEPPGTPWGERLAVWRWPADYWRFLKRETVGDGEDGAVVEAEEEAWTPPRHAVPFGPFLALGALEELFLGEWLRQVFDAAVTRWVA